MMLPCQVTLSFYSVSPTRMQGSEMCKDGGEEYKGESPKHACLRNGRSEWG